MSRGIIAIGVDDGDELIAARLTSGKDYIFLGSHDGQAIRFKEDRFAHGPAGPRRARHGSGGGRFHRRRGSGQRRRADPLHLRERLRQAHEADDYRLTNRGVKGVINMKTTRKTGKVVAILSVKEDSDLMIVTRDGKMIRIDSGEIRQAGRSTQGVRLVRMEENDQVAAACLIPESGRRWRNCLIG
jgi:DNA gyrase subunit A